MITLFSFALLGVGVFPVAYIALGFYHIGMCDPAPFVAGLWLLALTIIGSIVGFFSIYAARKTGRYFKIASGLGVAYALVGALPFSAVGALGH